MNDDGDAAGKEAGSANLSTWSRVLPPGWLDRYRADLRGSLSSHAAAVGSPAGPRPRAWRTRWSSGRVVRAGGVAATLLAIGLLIGSTLPDPGPRRSPAPLRQPGGLAPVLGSSQPTATPPVTSTPTPAPTPGTAPRGAAGGRQQPGGYPAAVPTSPRWGYAWMDQATARHGVEVRLDPQWQWTTGRDIRATAGRRATAVHRATGSYAVRLPGAGFPLGTAHATSFANGRYYYSPPDDGHSCAVAGYRQSGADELVDVRCHDRYGDPVDVQFDVFFAAPNAGPGPYAAVRYDPPGGGTRAPARNAGTWNTAGGTVSVYQQDSGRWRVVLQGASLATGNGYVHVTAYGTGAPARCRPVSTAPAAGGRALEVVVACYAITAGPARPVNSQWTLTYTGRAGLQHAGSAPAAYATTAGDPARPVIDRRRSWASSGETPALARLGVGAYRLTYAALGRPDDAPQVTAFGALPRHCRLYWWDSYSAPPRVSVDVICYDPAGERADALFALAYLRSP